MSKFPEWGAFYPDKGGIQVNLTGDLVVANYLLDKLDEAKHRVEVCGCAQCQGRLNFAEEGISWLIGEEPEMQIPVKKKKKHR